MEATTSATKATNKPVKAFRLDDVSVSVFANDRMVKDQAVTLYNLTINRLYKKDNKTLRTQTFGSADIGKITYLLGQADEFVRDRRNPDLKKNA